MPLPSTIKEMIYVEVTQQPVTLLIVLEWFFLLRMTTWFFFNSLIQYMSNVSIYHYDYNKSHDDDLRCNINIVIELVDLSIFI